MYVVVSKESNLQRLRWGRWKIVATCDGTVPTTANGRVVPTATTEDVRPAIWVVTGKL